MSKIRKAMQRARENGEWEPFTDSLADRVRPEKDGEHTSEFFSDREQLENEITKLLRVEHPDILPSKKKLIKLNYTKTETFQLDAEALHANSIFVLNQEIELAKQIELLRFQVLKKLEMLNGNSVMITSARHKEGKTFIASNLAVSLSQNLNRTVMLIDADLKKRPYQRRNIAGIFFNSNNRPGLSDYLLEDVEISALLVNPGIPRLTVLPSGRALADSSTILGSAKMESLINDLKSRYSKERILVFDCSSCLSAADSLVLSRLVDAVLIVVENEKTDGKAIIRTTELLDDKIIIGAVMNKTQ